MWFNTNDIVFWHNFFKLSSKTTKHLPLLATSQAISKRTASSKSNSSSHSSSPDRDVTDRLRASGMLGKYRRHSAETGTPYNHTHTDTKRKCHVLQLFPSSSHVLGYTLPACLFLSHTDFKLLIFDKSMSSFLIRCLNHKQKPLLIFKLHQVNLKRLQWAISS